MIPHCYSDDTLQVFLEGVPHSVDKSHANWDKIKSALKDPDTTTEDMVKLVSVRTYVQSRNIHGVVITNDAIMYNGKVVHNHLTQRMMTLLADGYDISPWVAFMDNLMNNPSKTAVDELYLWLEKSKMPITEDGCFLAYKKVKSDYTSYHSNPDGSDFYNHLGSFVSMPRNEVDDNRDRTCSAGLHFCSWDYLPHYMGNQGRVLVVKVNPADVVSIPSDYDNAKGRASGYLIWDEVDEKKTRHLFDDVPVVDTSDDLYQDWLDAVNSGETELGFDDWVN